MTYRAFFRCPNAMMLYCSVILKLKTTATCSACCSGDTLRKESTPDLTIHRFLGFFGAVPCSMRMLHDLELVCVLQLRLSEPRLPRFLDGREKPFVHVLSAG